MAFRQGSVDHEKVEAPELGITERARAQLDLILANDYTLEDRVLRVAINGKGCDGFHYAVYFDQLKKDDLLCVTWNQKDLTFPVVADAFTAYYLQEATLDFYQNPLEDLEGFVVLNHNQENFKGKFWRAKPELTPPLEQN